MRRTTIIGVLVVALVAAACGDDDTTPTPAPTTTTQATQPGETTTTQPDDGPLAEHGESTDADPALVMRALGTTEGVPDIVLAAIARAHQDLDEATIAKALECWNTVECDTGTGGPITMGVADGGRLNVWRQVTHMEAILQALTYPEIGRIISRDAQWSLDPAVPEADIRFLVQAGVDFIIGYPDWGVALAPAILEATAAGIPYIPYSAGWVGLPGDPGSLVPGQDYLTIVGEDLCALGESFADVINDHVGSGRIGILGGTPGNALSEGWQRCHIAALGDGITYDGPADTFWVNDVALQVVLGWLSANPDIRGFSYEYADGLYTALDAYDQLGIELDELVIVVRTDEQTLFCEWAERGNPNFRIFYSAGGNFQSRIAVTAAMMYLKGADIPAEIVVPHVMREVTAADCDPNRVTPDVSGTSLVPSEVLGRMYSG